MDKAAQLNGSFAIGKARSRSDAGSMAPEQAVDNSMTGSNMTEINLLQAEVGRTYTVKRIETDDEEMNAFLFRLGCYSGEEITVVSKKRKSCVVVIKDGRYSLDELLASAIIV